MANLEQMLNVQQLGSSSQLSATGSIVGGAVGTMFGNPVVGAAAGSAIGSAVGALIPTYSHVKGSVSGINFVQMNIRPYQITLIEPNDDVAKNISDYYCYMGCKTSRTESLNIPSYMYKNHAFVKGNLQYNGSVPLDKFMQIRNMFSRGVHILNE